MYVSSYCCICVLIGEHNRSVHLQLYSKHASLDRRCSRSHGHKLCVQLGRQLLVFDNCNATVGREQQGGAAAAPDCAGRGELALGPHGGAEGVRRHRDLSLLDLEWGGERPKDIAECCASLPRDVARGGRQDQVGLDLER